MNRNIIVEINRSDERSNHWHALASTLTSLTCRITKRRAQNLNC